MSVAAISNKGSANGEGIELVDINPTKGENGYTPSNVDYQMAGEVMLGYGNYPASGGSPKGLVSFLPVQGYEAISIKKVSSDGTLNVCFADSSGNLTTAVEVGNTAWTDLEIPSSAVNLVFYSQESSVSTHRVWYSLKSRKKVTPRVVADDINPNKLSSLQYNTVFRNSTSYVTLPVAGYSKVYLWVASGSYASSSYGFWNENNNAYVFDNTFTLGTTPYEIVLPEGTKTIAFKSSAGSVYYSIIA